MLNFKELPLAGSMKTLLSTLLTGVCLFVLLMLSACGTEEEPTLAASKATTTVIPTLPTPVEFVTTPAPVASDTPEPSGPTTVRPTVTSPVPTFTPMPTETPTPTATPEPTTYLVQSGDTLLGIAADYGVSIEALSLANGAASPDELTIIVGQQLQIPLCQVHQVVAGNTLAAIALSCGIALDDLVIANIGKLAQLGSLDSIPLGFLLTIPQESSAAGEIECDLLPERLQVIEYTPKSGEGLYCLSQKYAISAATILRANLDRLTGGQPYGSVPLLFPPVDGAIYSVSQEDIDNGVGLEELAEWYEVEVGAITDWNGNRIQEPLSQGQQLLIAEANLLNGPFRFQQSQ